MLVRKRMSVGFSAFDGWANQIPDNRGGIREPGFMGAQFETPYYDLDGLKDAIFYRDDSSQTGGSHFIYDRGTNRLLFCRWSS